MTNFLPFFPNNLFNFLFYFIRMPKVF